MYGGLSRVFRRDRTPEPPESNPLNANPPRNLTGKVRIDKSKEEFLGGYSFVYKGVYKRQVVIIII
ncbi:hypothetical protein M408DRAFT_111480 [Serendipita vermifera MAFF 305830]|uniref:Uncharacterized protein n=1 Tax=Serendipita vermifera MAFF 305830 TaxID=933852 RepID=A0A0C2W3M6_SERVB|nr:hypothetical protein M408DRAFT_111480 [Serendipita vermifera MAFF 305830]